MTSTFSSENLENIVFDFGGVLLDIDYQKTYTALSELLNIEFNINSITPEMTTVLADFETGKINIETFLWNIQRLAKNEVPIGQAVIKAWNAMLLGWNPSKFNFLLSLRQRYKVYLLSNTNELHLDWVLRDLKTKHEINDFDNRFFDKTFYSHIIGLKKPDREIFEFVTNDLNLDVQKTLFIDDLLPNIEAASHYGWQTYHHNPSDDLIEIFTEKLKLL